MKHKIFLISVALAAFLPVAASAATLYITPSTGAYRAGELFSLLINVNTAGAPINAASGQLSFDNSRLEVSGLGFSSSILTLWTQEPAFSNAAGSVTFSGGLPNPGFNGPSGVVLRVTFKPKAGGQATVNFVSGSVLANDGKGTNVLSSFSGGIFNILAAAKAEEKPKEAPKAPEPTVGVAVRPIEAPLITDWPKALEAGQSLTIKGLALPTSKILITVEKGSEEPIRDETFTGPDGRFAFTFPTPVVGGLYRVSARTVTADGVVSARSETVTIEVVQPLFFRIGNVALNYASIIVTLISLIIFLALVLVFAWWRMRLWQKRQGVEISEAEGAVHEGFEALKSAVRRYLRYMAQSKSASTIKRKEEETEELLEEGLKDIEKEVEKEVGDIRHPKKYHKHEEE